MNTQVYLDQLPTVKSAPYMALAAIYDLVMKHVNYAQWAGYIEKIIRKHFQFNPLILDVGCGTGEFVRKMSELNFQADGCDPSYAMIEIAIKKNKKNLFWIDSLPELSKTEPFKYQVLTCLYDTINYLSTMEYIIKALRRVYEILPPDGIFIFDVVSEDLCQHYFHLKDEKGTLEEKYAYLRKSFYDKKNHQQINEFSIYTPEGIFEERHVQYIYSFEEIRKKIVETTSFHIAGIYDDFTYTPAEETSNRAHFVLKK
jgi:SAM-dependent methyltransferase